MGSITPQEPIEDQYPVGEEISWAGTKMKVERITGPEGGCVITKVDADPRFPNSQYVPRRVIDTLLSEQIEVGLCLPTVILWLDNEALPIRVTISEITGTKVSLKDNEGRDYGSIDPVTLSKYIKQGRQLQQEYSRPFTMRSNRDPNKLYYNCRIRGINLANGKIVVTGVDERGNNCNKEQIDENDLDLHMV